MNLINFFCVWFHSVETKQVGGFYHDDATEHRCKTCGRTWTIDHEWRYRSNGIR